MWDQNRGWLGYLGDDTTHLYWGIIKNIYNKPTNKDPYEPASISWNVKQVGNDHLITADVGIPIIENKSPWHSGPRSFRTWKPASPHTKMGHPERVVYLPTINFQRVR